jgi:translation initiation factor 4E
MEQSANSPNSCLVEKPDTSTELHKLSDSWTLWAHLPHDTDWSLKSYSEVLTFNNIEELITLNNTIPERMLKNCMLFMMKEGIKPIWEDSENRDGGCFSYRISNKFIKNIWDELSYRIVGNNSSDNKDLIKTINGITVSPKKNFCILKIWLKTSKYQDPSEICEFENFSPNGCLFKRHNPEY